MNPSPRSPSARALDAPNPSDTATSLRRERVAVVGAGIAGLAAARALAPHADVTVFEAAAQCGGHARTVEITLPDAHGRRTTFGVDTGFLVCNARTYPGLMALFAELGVPLAPSEMTFSVQAAGLGPGGTTLEWAGTSLNTLFAQRANLLRPAFLRMVADILRFNRLGTAEAQRIAAGQPGPDAARPLGEWLQDHGFGTLFLEGYLLPMTGCIWSCPPGQMLAFPAATLLTFCHNHGLLAVRNRPQWLTVAGGSRHYVERITATLHAVRTRTPVTGLTRTEQGVTVHTAADATDFDAVVLACHTDQSRALLGTQITPAESALLGAIRYQPNHAVLHTDARLLPARPQAWAAWNHEQGLAGHPSSPSGGICLHYLINRLQPLPLDTPVIVSLNPQRMPDPATILDEWHPEHPILDSAAVAARQSLPALQGTLRTWYCGAWDGYGFHEDGLQSGLRAAASLRAQRIPHASGAPRMPDQHAA